MTEVLWGSPHRPGVEVGEGGKPREAGQSKSSHGPTPTPTATPTEQHPSGAGRTRTRHPVLTRPSKQPEWEVRDESVLGWGVGGQRAGCGLGDLSARRTWGPWLGGTRKEVGSQVGMKQRWLRESACGPTSLAPCKGGGGGGREGCYQPDRSEGSSLCLPLSGHSLPKA